MTSRPEAGAPGHRRDDLIAQRFLAGSWYDALPMMPLAMAHSRVLGNAFHDHARTRASRASPSRSHR